jgi:hypothetical protein
MMNDREPDIGQMWRQQPQEKHDMTLDTIRMKARELDARVRRWNVMGGIALAALAVKNVWEVWIDTDVVERVGDLLVLVALLLVVLRFRGYMRAAAAPETLGLASCIEHYRSRLARLRDESRDSWKWVLLFVPGIGLNVVGGMLETRSAAQIAILIVIGVATFAGVLWVNARTARQLDRDIAALESE